MDHKTFDAFARTISTASRRGLLASVVTTLLTVVPIVPYPRDVAARKKRKKRKKKRRGSPSPVPPPPTAPPPCVPNCSGKACGDDGCGGSCGTCGNVPCREVCQGGACLSANDSPCNGTGRCLNGTCNPDPLCGAGGLSLCTQATAGACCSNTCVDDICAPGNPGDECVLRTDCNGVGCLGFRCY